MTRIILALVVLASLSCSNANEPTRLACETNNTGTVRFKNDSTDGRIVYDIVWDGVRIVQRLAATQTSEPTTAVAGVAHTLIFLDSTTNAVRCGAATPILIRCQERTITCAF